MKKYIFCGTLLFTNVLAYTQQDPHFSQFYSTPLSINPAMAGNFEGGFRMNLDYRTQWTSVTTPWKTMSATGDFRFGEDETSGNFFNGGAMFYTDKAGDSKFKTGLYNAIFGYTVHISKGAYFTTAIQGGVIQNSINYSDLYWESQYNGYEFDNSRPTNENQSGALSFTKGDLSLGTYYLNAIDDKKTIYFGLAGNHLLAHKVNFGTLTDRIYRKFTFHGGAQFRMGNFGLLPNFMVLFQGPNRIINFGTEYKLWLKDQSHFTGFNDEISASIGTYYRLGDALMIGGKFNYAGFTLSGSYDITTSAFNAATNGRGALEILLGYRANFGIGKGTHSRFL